MDIIQIRQHLSRPRKRRVLPQQRPFCDSFGRVSHQSRLMRHDDVQDIRKNVVQTFLGQESRTKHFVTDESYAYISPRASYARTFGREYIDVRKRFDGVHMRSVQHFTPQERFYNVLNTQFSSWRSQFRALGNMRSMDLSPVRMWQMSMACAMVFGMITISMLYKNFGGSVQAKSVSSPLTASADSVGMAYEVQQGASTVATKVYSEEELIEQKRVAAARVALDLEHAAQESNSKKRSK